MRKEYQPQPDTNPGHSAKEASYPLHLAKDLDPLLDRIGDAHYVLLGEASHGTHEYYTWRSAITKRLIQEKGFSFIAVEGDWPDCYCINRFIKGYDNSGTHSVGILKSFERWPTWMWSNWEIVALVDWLRGYNEDMPAHKKAGFYGLDVYSLWESLDTLNKYLEKKDPSTAQLVKQAIHCFEPYREDEYEYAKATGQVIPQSCRNEVLALLQEIRKKSPSYGREHEASLDTEMNAWVVANAERYYESMISFGNDSWNIRDTHMVDTLQRLMQFHGPNAKAIVWEHNTHIGDARFTDMRGTGMVTVGQLVREQHDAKDVVLVGMGSYQGSVIAGNYWGAPMQKLRLPEAREDSVEALLHKESTQDRLLIFNPDSEKERFNKSLGHRAVGVVYHPERERYGNYVPSVLAKRYDAFIYLDKTQALFPLAMDAGSHKTPETYPFGV